MKRKDEAKVVAELGANPLPFFAEYPYFLWGEVNYDSDGDCSRPTDTGWSELYLELRSQDVPRDRLQIHVQLDGLRRATISGSVQASVELAAYLTALRSGATPAAPSSETDASLARRVGDADRVRRMFADPALAPFDSHGWWGGWKWSGDFSTDMTSGLCAVLQAVHARSADPELLAWLRNWQAKGPQPFHRDGVQHALRLLTSRTR